MSDFLPIRAACDYVGGLQSLSRHLGVAAPVVHKWATGKQPVPIIRCVEIEKLTEGHITRQQLRPDDWDQIWPELVSKVSNNALG